MSSTGGEKSTRERELISLYESARPTRSRPPPRTSAATPDSSVRIEWNEDSHVLRGKSPEKPSPSNTKIRPAQGDPYAAPQGGWMKPGKGTGGNPSRLMPGHGTGGNPHRVRTPSSPFRQTAHPSAVSSAPRRPPHASSAGGGGGVSASASFSHDRAAAPSSVSAWEGGSAPVVRSQSEAIVRAAALDVSADSADAPSSAASSATSSRPPRRPAGDDQAARKSLSSSSSHPLAGSSSSLARSPYFSPYGARAAASGAHAASDRSAARPGSRSGVLGAPGGGGSSALGRPGGGAGSRPNTSEGAMRGGARLAGRPQQQSQQPRPNTSGAIGHGGAYRPELDLQDEQEDESVEVAAGGVAALRISSATHETTNRPGTSDGSTSRPGTSQGYGRSSLGLSKRSVHRAEPDQQPTYAGTSEQYSGAGEPMPAHKNARDAATPSKNRQASRGSSRQDRRETCGLGETSPPPSPGQKSRGVRKEAVPTTAWTASPGGSYSMRFRDDSSPSPPSSPEISPRLEGAPQSKKQASSPNHRPSASPRVQSNSDSKSLTSPKGNSTSHRGLNARHTSENLNHSAGELSAIGKGEVGTGGCERRRSTSGPIESTVSAAAESNGKTETRQPGKILKPHRSPQTSPLPSPKTVPEDSCGVEESSTGNEVELPRSSRRPSKLRVDDASLGDQLSGAPGEAGAPAAPTRSIGSRHKRGDSAKASTPSRRNASVVPVPERTGRAQQSSLHSDDNDASLPTSLESQRGDNLPDHRRVSSEGLLAEGPGSPNRTMEAAQMHAPVEGRRSTNSTRVGTAPPQGGKATSGRTSKREGSSRSEREELDKRAGARSRPRAGRDSVRDAKQPLAYQPPKTADPSHVGLSARQKRMSELESESEDEPGHGGGGYNNMSLQDYMASLVTTPAAMEKDSGLGTLAPSLWVGIEENPHGEGETDDEMIIPPEYALDLSQYDLKSMRASAMKKPFMGPSSQNATRTGWDANCNPRSEKFPKQGASPRGSRASEPSEAGMDAFMRPASGNTYDLRPATSCAEGGRGRRQNWQDGGYDVRGSSDHSGNETKQVDLAGMSGALFIPKEPRTRATHTQQLQQQLQQQQQQQAHETVHMQPHRVASAHGRAEGAAMEMITASQFMERPPSRQKPPPEALHLFQDATSSRSAVHQHGAPSHQHRPMTSSAAMRPRTARPASTLAPAQTDTRRTLKRPPSRQRPPPESLCLEAPPASAASEIYWEIFRSSSDEEEEIVYSHLG